MPPPASLKAPLPSASHSHPPTSTTPPPSPSQLCDVGMDMMLHGTGRDHPHRHGGLGLGLGLGLSLAVAGAAEVDGAPAAAPPPQPQCWRGGAGVFFSEAVDHQQQQRAACHEMPFLRGIDVNRAPAGRSCSEEDEEPGASSPNSTLSSLSAGKRGLPAGEHDQERAAASDDEDSGAGAASRKKLRLSKDQSAVLEESFKEHNTLNPKQKAALAKQLSLKPRQVEVWFQNRRARTKLKQTEVDCELLKRCCDTLTEENRRLHKEVQELRALKLVPPHLYMRMPPPTTLTICPSCDRFAASGKPADAAADPRLVPCGPWGPVQARPMFVDRPAQRP